MSSEVRIGIIGCARILNAHLRGFKVLQDHGHGDLFRIVALCARREEDALRFRKRGEGPPPRAAPVDAPGDPLNAPQMYVDDLHPGSPPEVYLDHREMIRNGGVDAVCVYTGHDSHHTLAVDAMSARKHVAVEKPMAISVKAAQRMCEVASDTGRVLGIDENVHFSPATRASAWAVRAGLIGEVQMVYRGTLGFGDRRPDLVAARTPWRQSKMAAGGGVSIDLGVHLFNGIRTICGPVKSVSAAWRTLEPTRVLLDDRDQGVVQEMVNEVDDAFFANFILEGGGIGHVAIARSARGTRVAVPGGTNIWGSRGALSDGRIFADDGSSEPVMDRYRRETPAALQAEDIPRGITDAFALEQLDWLQAIRDGRRPRMTGEEGLVDLALSYAILESGVLGRSVSLAEMLSGEAGAYQREINAHYGL